MAGRHDSRCRVIADLRACKMGSYGAFGVNSRLYTHLHRRKRSSQPRRVDVVKRSDGPTMCAHLAGGEISSAAAIRRVRARSPSLATVTGGDPVDDARGVPSMTGPGWYSTIPGSPPAPDDQCRTPAARRPRASAVGRNLRARPGGHAGCRRRHPRCTGRRLNQAAKRATAARCSGSPLRRLPPAARAPPARKAASFAARRLEPPVPVPPGAGRPRNGRRTARAPPVPRVPPRHQLQGAADAAAPGGGNRPPRLSAAPAAVFPVDRRDRVQRHRRQQLPLRRAQPGPAGDRPPAVA